MTTMMLNAYTVNQSNSEFQIHYERKFTPFILEFQAEQNGPVYTNISCMDCSIYSVTKLLFIQRKQKAKRPHPIHWKMNFLRQVSKINQFGSVADAAVLLQKIANTN